MNHLPSPKKQTQFKPNQSQSRNNPRAGLHYSDRVCTAPETTTLFQARFFPLTLARGYSWAPLSAAPRRSGTRLQLQISVEKAEYLSNDFRARVVHMAHAFLDDEPMLQPNFLALRRKTLHFAGTTSGAFQSKGSSASG